MAKRPKNKQKKTKAKRLILLGDVKESISSVDNITKKILENLQKKIDVIIVRGNHDGRIETICENVKPSVGIIYEGLALIHGNAWPAAELMKCRYLVSAHQHPQIELKDRSGKFYTKSAWLILPAAKSKIKKFYKFNKKIQLILIPAFNPLVGKTLKLNAEEHLGPLLSNKLFKLNQALVYQLNGITLGKLKNFKV